MAPSQQGEGKTFAVITTKRFRRDVKRLGRSSRYDLRKLDVIVQLLAFSCAPVRTHSFSMNDHYQ